ncbi:sensor histidine kinase [Nocardia goodfellowii]|uniref:histidine kinase n=1 Tax=Nocardia goodfellowii TaxID=882446 RepID=A0ABS4Q7Y2_9NOCA|nr:histidine kinase [Nocardia goodfellowii]MBP2187804.1 signal transduction histidine kinase [Nocardia goodfellowii]
MKAPDISKRGWVVKPSIAQRFREGRWSGDGWTPGLALIVAVVQVMGGRGANIGQAGTQPLDWLGYLLLLAGPIALLFRRRAPMVVLLVVLAVCTLYLALGYGYGPIFLSLIVAFLTAATVGSRWWTYPIVPLGYLAFVWPVPSWFGHQTNGWQVFGLLAWLTVLVGIAEGIRQRRTVLDARRQRAEAARRDEEAQRERRASEERLAIARELHDVLAHSLSLINVQSSVALELFDRRPEQAASALAAIKTASKDALAEVHTLLQTIRTGGVAEPVAEEDDSTVDEFSQRRLAREAAQERPVEQPRPAPRAPAASIEDLDALLQRSRTAGLPVSTRIIGEPQKLPSVIDAAAARIIQESLTNVARHAPGADATVTVRYAPESVDITIDNTRPLGNQPRSGTSGGNGIVGMRERAHALGGALTAGPRPSGGFRVAARLPMHTRDRAESATSGGSSAQDR